MNIKKILDRALFIVLIVFILLFFTGCGKLKDSKQIKKYLKNNYDINVKVLSEEESEESIKYTLQEKGRDVTFSCTSSMQQFMIDGSSFGKYEQTTDTYYTSLTKSIEKELQDISKKYNVEFEESYYGLIWLIKLDGEEIDFDKTQNIANEVMKAYDLKKEPSINKTDSIFIELNGETTDCYYKYTIDGKKTSLGNSKKDLYERWDVPEQVDEDAIDYINKLYEGENHIIETSVYPIYSQGDEIVHISYFIKNDTLEIREKFIFNLDEYKNDLNNNELQEMESYLKERTPYNYK